MPLPVISIGSLTVGGAGKSPITAFLAEFFLQKGFKPAILSRGYGRQNKELIVVADGQKVLASSWRESGDEPLLLAKQLGGKAIVIAHKNRYLGGLKARELGADVLLLDDGAQHRALSRDLDIIVLPAEAPLGNGYLLPAGPLRESPKRLKTANLLWLHGMATGNLPAHNLPTVRSAYKKPKIYLANGELLPLNGQKTLAFCGLARPAGFFASLNELNIELMERVAFADHHPYSPSDMAAICQKALSSGASLLITSAKDWVKVAGFPCPPDITLAYAATDIIISDEAPLDSELDKIISLIRTEK